MLGGKKVSSAEIAIRELEAKGYTVRKNEEGFGWFVENDGISRFEPFETRLAILAKTLPSLLEGSRLPDK
jgi:hypothetical protein